MPSRRSGLTILGIRGGNLPPAAIVEQGSAVRGAQSARWGEIRETVRDRSRGSVAVCCVVVWLLVASFPAVSAGAKKNDGRRFAVATENDASSAAAMQILEQGGNAADAAVTATLVAGVTTSSSSGLGGGGFALVWTAATKEVSALDFRETAPKTTDVAAFERRPFPPSERGRLVGAPGELAGLYELHRRFGRKPWAALVRPAIRLAEDGYTVSRHLAAMIGFMTPRFAGHERLLDMFAPRGRPLAEGARIRDPRLAATLERVAAEGPASLYAGATPVDFAAAATSAAGALTAEDVRSYHVHARDPIHISWEGYDVYTLGPPSGGGLMLAETLGTVTSAELEQLGLNSGAYTHLLAECLRASLADRMRYVSDPDQQPVDVPKLLATQRLTARRREISLDRTRALPTFVAEEHGTHALVFADSEGNVVSLTTTVNHPFGSMLQGRATGILLNDELDDFTLGSASHALGLAENPNRPRPEARPVSSITTTIVVKGGLPVLALGGSGGMTIGPNVTQALLARLVFGSTPGAAVSAPRFTIPTEGSTIALDASNTGLQADLEKRGEHVSIQTFNGSAVQMIALDHGHLSAAADPRKGGTALVE